MYSSGTIKTDKKQNVYARLCSIYEQYRNLAKGFDNLGIEIEEVHIEQLVTRTHVFTHYSVACIGLALYPFGCSVAGDIPIKSWQKFCDWENERKAYESGNKPWCDSEDRLAAICMGRYYTQGR